MPPQADLLPGTLDALILKAVSLRHYFAGRDPIGQYIKMYKSDGPAVQIIGVSGDVRSATLRTQRDEYFRPAALGGWSIGRRQAEGRRFGGYGDGVDRSLCGDRTFSQQPDARNRHSHCDRRRHRDVMWMVLKNGIAVTALGIAIGLPLAMLGSRMIRGLLFEVSPTDPVVLGASTILLALTGLAAGLWPARRATTVDPSQTLRFA